MSIQPHHLIFFKTMLRFNSTSSADINTNTFWSEVPFLGSQVVLNFTSSYSGHSKSIVADVISNKFNGYGGWVVIETDVNQIPTASGQYELDFYSIVTEQATWGSYLLQWINADVTFGDATNFSAGNLLSQERGFITGSDFDTWTPYNFQNNAIYNVYNG